MLEIREKNGLIHATGDRERPPGPLSGGSQGDHTTPYVTLEHQLINAVQGCTVEEAWSNLVETHKVYQRLPGYALSAKWLIEQSNDIYKNNSSCDPAMATTKDLNTYANNLLTIRNRLKYTALPTKGGSTGGNNEANTAGALQSLEGKLRNAHTTQYTKADVLKTMWDTFDHVRFQDINDSTEQKNILEQHVISIRDSYPMMSDYFGITEHDLVNAYPG